MSLADYTNKGFNKYSGKLGNFANSYKAAASRASSNYAKAGFGPTRTANYQRAISSYAQSNYAPTAAWADKWRTNYQAKMSE